MRAVPENNLAYPVLLQGSKGTGSGFLLRSGNDVFVVTAKHVLFDRASNTMLSENLTITCPSSDHADDGVHQYTVELKVTAPIAHPTSDVAVIRVGVAVDKPDSSGFVTHPIAGVKKIASATSGIVCVDPSAAKTLSQVLVSNDIFLFGYPVSLGLAPSTQFEFNRPLLRKGIVANTYSKQGTIILDCPGYPGNSGGPVIELEHDGLEIKYRLIGVLSEFIPQKLKRFSSHTGKEVEPEFANSGYSVAVCMDRVFDLVGYTPLPVQVTAELQTGFPLVGTSEVLP